VGHPVSKRVAQRRRRVVRCALLLLVALGCGRKPNVLLISLDACRPDHLSAYGYERDTSPFLAKLAARGVAFTHAFANTHGTPQSHTTILSSQYQETHRVMWDVLSDQGRGPGWVDAIPDDVVLLPEIMARNGYVTLAVTDGGFMAGRLGFDRGFVEFQEADGVRTGTAKLLEMVTRWIGDERPIFAFYHTYEVHSPYLPPASYRDLFGRFESDFVPTAENLAAFIERASDLSQGDIALIRARYDAEIRFADDTLRALFDGLAELGFLDDHLVIVTSDHGEEFGEHGGLLHLDRLYDELVRVPLIVSGARVPRGRVDDRMASSVDIVPTILRYTRSGDPAGFAGNDLLAPPRHRPDEQAVFMQYGNTRYAVRTRKWKLIENVTATHAPHYELYDLSEDPGEKNDVDARFPEVVADLRGLLTRWKTMAGSRAAESKQVILDPELLERLRALGYARE